MLRRTFVQCAAALVLPFEAAAAPVGIPAAPDLLSAVASLPGTVEGSGHGVIHVMFTPWCPVSPELWHSTRAITRLARIHWIPFSGGQPEGREAVDRFLATPSPSGIAQIFVKLQPIAHMPPTPLSDAQDLAIARVERLVIRDTGRGLVTPTIVYSIGADRVRVVPGGIPETQLQEIAQVAG